MHRATTTFHLVHCGSIFASLSMHGRCQQRQQQQRQQIETALTQMQAKRQMKVFYAKVAEVVVGEINIMASERLPNFRSLNVHRAPHFYRAAALPVPVRVRVRVRLSDDSFQVATCSLKPHSTIKQKQQQQQQQLEQELKGKTNLHAGNINRCTKYLTSQQQQLKSINLLIQFIYAAQDVQHATRNAALIRGAQGAGVGSGGCGGCGDDRRLQQN